MADKEETSKKTKAPTAKKRDIRNDNRRKINKSFKTRVRGAIRQLEEKIAKGDTQELPSSLSVVYSLLDKGVKRNIYKANKASRLKSRLTARTLKVSN